MTNGEKYKTAQERIEAMETWRDIVAEMRKSGRFGELNPAMGGVEIKTTMHDFADRIEEACNTMEDENAKLRRAMEPVMKVILGGCSLTDSYYAVREAQAIMNGGAE